MNFHPVISRFQGKMENRRHCHYSHHRNEDNQPDSFFHGIHPSDSFRRNSSSWPSREEVHETGKSGRYSGRFSLIDYLRFQFMRRVLPAASTSSRAAVGRWSPVSGIGFPPFGSESFFSRASMAACTVATAS